LKSSASPYQVPPEPGRWRAFALAALVHCVLLGFLWVGVSWQSITPVAVEAEIWSADQRAAAPPPPPNVEPEPAKPVPEPVKTPPKPAIAPEPPKEKMADPDIALEKIKERKLQEKEKLADEKALREAAQEKKKLAAAEEKKIQLEEDQRKRVQAEEEKKKLAEEQKRKQEEAAAEQRSAARRADDLRRMSSQAGSGTNGDAEKSQGGRVDASFASQAGAKIKSNTIFPRMEEIAGNPAVEFKVELLPDGSLKGKPQLLKRSGNDAFDTAVERAIEKSAPFRPDVNGKIPPNFVLQQKPKDN
jgi:colicin import membrane protein